MSCNLQALASQAHACMRGCSQPRLQLCKQKRQEAVPRRKAHSVGSTAVFEALAVRLLLTVCRQLGVSCPSAVQQALPGVSSAPLVQQVPRAERKAASQSGSGCGAGARMLPVSEACRREQSVGYSKFGMPAVVY